MKFWIAYVKIQFFQILAALPGARTWNRLHSQQGIEDMACRDVQAIFYSTKLGQIVANMLGDYSENNFTKMKISQAPVERFW